MKQFFPLILLFLIACNQPDPQLQSKLTALEEKLAVAEKALTQASVDETGFIHSVFFWMKKDVTEEQKATFAKDGLGALATISANYKTYIGPPAMTPRAEVVDNSYDFALICHFKDRAAHDKYQVDPIHRQFIEKYKDLWERVQVYDNLTSN